MNKIQIILRQSCAALMLIAALTIPALAASPTFSDVPEGSALQESVSCLVERGITNGTGTDIFSPNAPITVRQWAVMLCRAYGAEIHGENWRERSQNCVETAYAHGWLNETAVQAPDTRLCRSSLLESGLRTAGVPVYDACLFPGNESLSRLWLSVPSRETCPSSRDVAFIRSFRVVDFPAPFSPTSPKMQPAGRVKVMWSRVKPW